MLGLGCVDFAEKAEVGTFTAGRIALAVGIELAIFSVFFGVVSFLGIVTALLGAVILIGAGVGAMILIIAIVGRRGRGRRGYAHISV